MENSKESKNQNKDLSTSSGVRAWVIVIGVLVIFSLAAFGIVWVVGNSIQRTVAPVQDVAENLESQLTQILNPTPTIIPDPVTIIHSVRTLARLETIQYSVEKVIVAETNQGPFGFLFGDRLLLVARGTVIAGVDMQKLEPEDMELRQGVLYITLPEPEIFIATLDNANTFVYDRDRGVLTRGDINLETTARRAAELEIEMAAVQDGILDLARQNAESYLTRLLINLGYPDVIFIQPDGSSG